MEKNIENKILEENSIVVEKILEEAHRKATELVEKSLFEVEAFEKSELKKADKKGQEDFKRAIESSKLRFRNDVLKEKHCLLDSFFEKAIQKLENMSDEDFVNYCKKAITGLNLRGDEVIVFPLKRKECANESVDIKAILRNSKGLVVAVEDIEDGIIVRDGSICYDFTFKSCLERFKEDLTPVIIEKFLKNI